MKVLFITSFAETVAAGNGMLEAGMEVITKPFTTAALANSYSEAYRLVNNREQTVTHSISKTTSKKGADQLPSLYQASSGYREAL